MRQMHELMSQIIAVALQTYVHFDGSNKSRQKTQNFSLYVKQSRRAENAYLLHSLNRGSPITSCWKIDFSSSKLQEIKVKQVFSAYFGLFSNIRSILGIFCEKNQSQKNLKLVKNGIFHVFSSFYDQISVSEGPTFSFQSFFSLTYCLMSNIS